MPTHRGTSGVTLCRHLRFLCWSVDRHFLRLTLADLHHVQAITAWHWATTPPPPSVPRAGILAPRCRARQCQSSLLPMPGVIVSRSSLLYAGGEWKPSSRAAKVAEAPLVPFWSGRHSQFRPSTVTALQTQVSLVCIGHRVRSSSSGLARRRRPLSAGFPPRAVPPPDAGRSTLMSRLEHGSSEQLLSS